MNKEASKKRPGATIRHDKKIRRNAVCFLMILTLFLGGCSGSPGSGAHSAANDLSASDGPETKSQVPSSSAEQDASGEDGFYIDFNQPLALKAPNPAAGESPKILFVGNSHTYTNDLPDMFSQMTEAMGHESSVAEITQGSYSLTQYADPSDEMGAIVDQKLTEEEWDFVIIQEKTAEALFYSEENMLPAARILDEKIRAAGGQTALLMTWSPKEGAGIYGPEYIQAILALNLINVSRELDSLLIPGGMAFMRCMEQYSQIELWGEDGQHPSLEGSYLACCVAYAVIFRESPQGCTYTAGLDAETAAQLQALAAGFLTE